MWKLTGINVFLWQYKIMYNYYWHCIIPNVKSVYIHLKNITYQVNEVTFPLYWLSWETITGIILLNAIHCVNWTYTRLSSYVAHFCVVKRRQNIVMFPCERNVTTESNTFISSLISRWSGNNSICFEWILLVYRECSSNIAAWYR